MTGIRPSTSGVYLNAHPWRPAMPKAVTLPQHFMANGHEAVGCGKIYHGRFPDPPSWNDYEKKGADPKPIPKVLNGPRSRSGGIVWGILDVEETEMNDYRMASWAIDYLNQPHEKPFFLACGIFRPHMPWQVPRKYYDMYPLEKITLPKVLDTDLNDIPAAGKKMARPAGDHGTMLKTGNWKHAVQAYLASITFADVQVGRVLKALDAGRYADNTIVILWGDHGWHLGEKHHWRKFSLWEEATRAPLMISAPGITQAGSECRRTVDFMHVYPTLVELGGLPPRPGLDGKSMVRLLKNPQAKWSIPAITTHGRLNHAVRSERWRYIRYADGGEELYDHENDPLEWTNLAGKPGFAGVKKDLAAWLPRINAKSAPLERRRRTKSGQESKQKKAP